MKKAYYLSKISQNSVLIKRINLSKRAKIKKIKFNRLEKTINGNL